MPMLTPDLFDAVTEIFNIGVGHAAKRLRDMLDSTVSVNMPHVEIIMEAEMVEEFSIADEKFLVGTTMAFEGGYGGEAMFLMRSSSALKLAQRIVDRHFDGSAKVSTQEVMEEAGNVVTTSCFTKIADVLEVRLKNAPPIYLAGMADIRNRFREQMSDDIIWFRFCFSVDNLSIEGYIYFLMDPMHTFLDAVQKLVDKTITRPSE